MRFRERDDEILGGPLHALEMSGSISISLCFECLLPYIYSGQSRFSLSHFLSQFHFTCPTSPNLPLPDPSYGFTSHRCPRLPRLVFPIYCFPSPLPFHLLLLPQHLNHFPPPHCLDASKEVTKCRREKFFAFIDNASSSQLGALGMNHY